MSWHWASEYSRPEIRESDAAQIWDIGNPLTQSLIDSGGGVGNDIRVTIRWKLLTLPVLLGVLTSPMYSDRSASAQSKVDSIIVFKAKREMQLLSDGKVVRTYKIALGGVPIGAKERQGDHRTPEGKYTITGRNTASKFHRSLRLSYPNPQDRARAAKLGVAPGGDIMIHGLPNGYGWIGRGHLARDWTDGCIAVTDQEIEEIWKMVPDGTKVEIRP